MGINAKHLGFTLLELITVLAIIAVLVAVILPVYISSRKQADNATCISNLRQIGVAIGVYSADYDSHYPFACSPQDPDNPNSSVLSAATIANMTPVNVVLTPYLSASQCWKCPLDSSNYYPKYGASYAYSDYLDIPDVVFDTDVSKTPLVYDGAVSWHTSDPTPDTNSDYVNVVYADLHARRSSWFNATVIHVGS